MAQRNIEDMGHPLLSSSASRAAASAGRFAAVLSSMPRFHLLQKKSAKRAWHELLALRLNRDARCFWDALMVLSDGHTMPRTCVVQDSHLQHGCTSRLVDKPTAFAQVVQPPEPAPQKGPSRVGLAVLLGAGLLLVATWHKLTSRCSSQPQHMLGTGLACGIHVCCAGGCLSALQKRVCHSARL